jgi:hypothetical protein
MGVGRVLVHAAADAVFQRFKFVASRFRPPVVGCVRQSAVKSRPQQRKQLTSVPERAALTDADLFDDAAQVTRLGSIFQLGGCPEPDYEGLHPAIVQPGA